MQTKPVMLITHDLLMSYWPQVEPLLATCPVAEELPPEAIKQAVMAGQLFMFVFAKPTDAGPEVELVMVLNMVPSETLPAVNIVAIAGTNLRENVQQHWEAFKGWCHMNGARAIDAYVPERMEQFMEQELGLKRETIHVRLRL